MHIFVVVKKPMTEKYYSFLISSILQSEYFWVTATRR